MTTAVGRDGFPAYTLHQRAKSDRSEPGRIHLLEHHLADVGACFEALLGQPTIRKRLARTGGREDLDRATVSRLSVLAALHDIGKVNMGFQTQIWRPEDLPGGRVPAYFRRVGHTRDTVPVLEENGDTETSGWFFPALGFDEMLAWDDRDGLTACGMFVATLSHHGLPLSLEDTLPANSAVWRSFGGLDPQECVGRIAGLVREWFPDAFGGNGEALPPQPAFQHMFLGLCTLADWIGSDEGWFEYRGVPEDGYMAHARRQARRAVEAIGLDITEQRVLLGGMPTRTGFADLFDVPGGAPNAIQRRAALETPLDEPLVIIESETGSGKTEAALWRFARMYEAGLVDGLYFALPTRSAASQLHARVNRFIARMFPEEQRPEPVLAVPGYLKAGDFTGKDLGHYEVWLEDQSSGGTPGRRWAAEGAKRFLAAQIAVGTVDQAMMGALKVRHAHMRAACLARNLLVVDEVHASDTYMRVIIENLLEAHLGAGGYALLMSATLGSHARRSLLSAGRSRFGAGSSITTAAVIAATEQLRDSLLHQLLTRVPGWHTAWKDVPGLGTIPAAWEVVRLGEVIGSTTYGTNIQLGRDGAVAVLRMNNLQGGELDLRDVRRADLSEKESNDLSLVPGDILFNRTNSRDLVGKVAIVRDLEQPVSFASYLIRLRAAKTRANPYWLVALLGSSQCQDRIRKFATPGVSQANINPTNLKSLTISLPSLAWPQCRHTRLLISSAARKNRWKYSSMEWHS